MGRFGNSWSCPAGLLLFSPSAGHKWLCWRPQLLFDSVTQEVWVQFPVLLWVSQGFGMSFPWQRLRL